MKIVYDESKRNAVLAARGLDFRNAEEAFVGFHLTRPDHGHSEAEDRYHTLGLVSGVLALIVWTEREGERRIVTMWKANEKERRNYDRIRQSLG